MLVPIFINTPKWVWAVLACLLLIGLSQTRQRRAGLARTALVPLALAGFSLYGTVSAFGASPLVWAAWGIPAVLVAQAVLNRPVPKGVRYDAAVRQFELPGSWVPLMLIAGIFLTKYVVGVSLALNPSLKADIIFTTGVAALSGLFSGVFAGRTARLLGLALQLRSRRVAPVLTN